MLSRIRPVVRARALQRLGGPAAVIAAAALPAGAFAALLSLTNATAPRFHPPEPPPPSPWVVARAEGTVAGACQIAAVVRDADGATRSGVDLRLSRVTTEGSADIWRAISDGDGAHRFLDLPAGTYHLTALADDRAPAASPEWRCTGQSDRAFFELPLREAAHVFEGKIVSRAGGVAAGAELAIAQEGDVRNALAGPARVPVAPDGTFSVRIAPGKYILQVQAPHHASTLRKLSFDDSQPRSTAKLALTPAPQVRGRVVDENGQPLAGAVVALGGVLDPKQRAARVITESDGTFALPVSLGQDIVVTARGNDLVAQSALGVANQPLGFMGVELVARAGRAVEGTVSKLDGSAWAFGEIRYRVRELGLTGTEKADADGRFVLAGMPAGADVEVWAEGNASGAWGAQVASPGNDVLALVYVPPAY